MAVGLSAVLDRGAGRGLDSSRGGGGRWQRSLHSASWNKKLSYCCDSRSYCVQKYDRL